MRKIIVHGGAGTVPPEIQQKREPLLAEAAQVGMEALSEGPERAVEASDQCLGGFGMVQCRLRWGNPTGRGGAAGRLDHEFQAGVRRSHLAAGR